MEDLTTFKSITVSGVFQYGDKDFIFANGVDNSIMPIHPKEFTYYKEELENDKKFIRVNLVKERSNLLSFGIYGRNFEKSSTAPLRVGKCLLLVLMGILLSII